MKKFTLIKINLFTSLFFALPTEIYSMTDFSLDDYDIIEEFTVDDVKANDVNGFQDVFSSTSELPFFNLSQMSEPLKEFSEMRSNNEPAKLINTQNDSSSDEENIGNGYGSENDLNELFKQINVVIYHDMYERTKVLKNSGLKQLDKKEVKLKSIQPADQLRIILNDNSNISIFERHIAALRKINFGHLPINPFFTKIIANLIIDSVNKWVITEHNVENLKLRFFVLKIHPASLAMINEYIQSKLKRLRKSEQELINTIIDSFKQDIANFKKAISIR